jgi:hypothetical protein
MAATPVAPARAEKRTGKTDTPTEKADKPAELTARIAVYPSARIRPIPSFVFSVPDGWVLDEAASALVVARTAEAVDGFWVNAVLSHDRLPRSVDFKQAAQVSWARAQQSTPSAKVTMERLARFGDNAVYLRGVELDGPKGRALAQLHALFFAPADGEGKTVDFFQLVGTCPRELMDTYAPDFLEVIGSFRFTAQV